jgi:polysaccharide export outer membrane protein
MKFLFLTRMLITGLTFLGIMGAATMVWAQDDLYRVRPGDILRIEVIEDASLNRTVLVRPDGRITLPLAGSLNAGGRSVEAVQSSLAILLAPNFATTPNVFVSIDRLGERPLDTLTGEAPEPTIDIYVLGEVARPGKLALSTDTTVLQLFAQMGGFTNFAAKKRIQLRRTLKSGEEKIYTLNYNAIESGASRNGMVALADGDMIVVPQRRLFE